MLEKEKQGVSLSLSDLFSSLITLMYAKDLQPSKQSPEKSWIKKEFLSAICKGDNKKLENLIKLHRNFLGELTPDKSYFPNRKWIMDLAYNLGELECFKTLINVEIACGANSAADEKKDQALVNSLVPVFIKVIKRDDAETFLMLMKLKNVQQVLLNQALLDNLMGNLSSRRKAGSFSLSVFSGATDGFLAACLDAFDKVFLRQGHVGCLKHYIETFKCYDVKIENATGVSSTFSTESRFIERLKDLAMYQNRSEFVEYIEMEQRETQPKITSSHKARQVH